VAEVLRRKDVSLDVHGERRVEIGARFGQHRDAGEAKGCEPVEFVLRHELLRFEFWDCGCGLA
jgi:hypothetical protein